MEGRLWWVFGGGAWECWMEVYGGYAVEVGLTKEEALWRLRRGRFGRQAADAVIEREVVERPIERSRIAQGSRGG